jgi:hypothetical protein
MNHLSLFTAVLVGLGSGFIGTLLTIFLTPKLQHKFWTRQQRFELCLAHIKVLQEATARMLVQLLEQRENYRVADETQQKIWLSLQNERGNLFSDKALWAFSFFEDLMVELYDPVVPGFKSESDFDEFLDSFLNARDVAFKGLYRDIGIYARSGRVFSRLRWYPREIGFALKKMIGAKPDIIDDLLTHPEIRQYEKETSRREVRRRRFAATAARHPQEQAESPKRN